MSAIVTAIPILLIRYGLLFFVNKEALLRAGLFAPLVGKERTAYAVYQLSTLAILICLLFLRIETYFNWFNEGIAVYGIGVILYAFAGYNFAKPNKHGMNQKGLYRISRNPMYVACFICFLGCVMLTCSPLLLILVSAFQISAHWIILSEERWCSEQFGKEYADYSGRVRRYL